MLTSVTERLASELATRLHEIPARHYPAIAAHLVEALAYFDPLHPPRLAADRFRDAPYACRICQRGGAAEHFEDLNELLEHRRAHLVAEQVPAAERRPVLAAVISLSRRRRFGRAARYGATPGGAAQSNHVGHAADPREV